MILPTKIPNNRNAPAARKFQKLLRKGRASLELATTYLDDGALASAAEHYRLAADWLDAAAAVRRDQLVS